MSRPSRAAFTLVELLVVITVIAMLMALLIPAAYMFIARAKQTQCLNNLKEIGQACLVYETNRQHYPPENSNITSRNVGAGNGTGFCVTWPAYLTGYLGRGDLSGLNDTSATPAPWYSYMPVFVCPANPPEQLDELVPALGYACTAGRKNNGGTASTPSDWKDNGVFMEFKKNQMTENVTKEFVNRNDGCQMTLMVMETLTAGNWSVVVDPSQPNLSEIRVGIVWPHSYQDLSQTPPHPAAQWPSADDTRVNEPYVLKNYSTITQSTISSKHSGGSNVVFCDSHAIFLNQDIDPIVIEYMMTPNGKNIRNPGDPTKIPGGQNIKMASLRTSLSTLDFEP